LHQQLVFYYQYIMISNALIIRTMPIGVIDFSPIISVGVGAFFMLCPNYTNVYIKKISLFIAGSGPSSNLILKFYNVRFRLINRDFSDNVNLAGEIINPVSGVFTGSLPKDGFPYIMLSSEKNFIEFKDPIYAGGLQFLTSRFILNQASIATQDIRILIQIDYE
jgi:hypothetical protein